MNNICPKCGASRDALIDSMEELEPTDNFEIAVKMVENCPCCKKTLGGLMEECINIVKGGKHGIRART